MQQTSGLNRIRAYLEEASSEVRRNKIQLPYRDACAQLQEVLRHALPQGMHMGTPVKTDDSFMIGVYDDQIDLHGAVGIEYLGPGTSMLVYKFPKLDRREEPTPTESALLERDPELRAKAESYFPWLRENQRQCRRVRDELIENIASQWKELQQEMGAGARAVAAEQSPQRKPPYNGLHEEVWTDRMALYLHAKELRAVNRESWERAIAPILRYYDRSNLAWPPTASEIKQVSGHAKDRYQRAVELKDRRMLDAVRTRVNEVKAQMEQRKK